MDGCRGWSGLTRVVFVCIRIFGMDGWAGWIPAFAGMTGAGRDEWRPYGWFSTYPSRDQERGEAKAARTASGATTRMELQLVE